MTEDFINYLWQYRLIDQNLTTTSGEEIKVISPGTRNMDSGPDFFNAMIEFGNTKWAGNVEIHVYSSDWYRHNHQNNLVYDNIILHVVYGDDKPVYRKNNELIPTIELAGKFNPSILNKYQSFIASKNSIPCHNLLHTINHFDKLSWFDSLMAERLEKKSDEIIELLNISKNDFSQVFYQRLARGMGYTVNADAMEILAASLPINLLAKHKDSLLQIEALLFGNAGLLPDNVNDKYSIELVNEYAFLKTKYKLSPMNSSLWRFMRMRPVSFPTIRISQLANIIYSSSGLLNRIIETGRLQDVISLLSASASPYWDNHYQFEKIAPGKGKKLGLSTINIILINTIIPFLFVFGKIKNDNSLQDKAIDWLSQVKPESNSIIRQFASSGITTENAMHTQALIQLKNNYCVKKRCLSCRFGHLLVRS
jgi:hypothetical protein